MLLDFEVIIRSYDRLEVGRSSESSGSHNTSQQSIVLNWGFAEAIFIATDLDPKKTPNCSEHLLPTCINFEFESDFSTTWPQKPSFAHPTRQIPQSHARRRAVEHKRTSRKAAYAEQSRRISSVTTPSQETIRKVRLPHMASALCLKHHNKAT